MAVRKDRNSTKSVEGREVRGTVSPNKYILQ